MAAEVAKPCKHGFPQYTPGQAPQLVLDADALNAIAASPALAQQLTARAARQQPTILTPHPLEAARLLQTSTTAIQAHRPQACLQLGAKISVHSPPGSARYRGDCQCTAENSSPQRQRPLGLRRHRRCACRLIGALWAQGSNADEAAIQGAFKHGHTADQWLADRPFSAGALAMTRSKSAAKPSLAVATSREAAGGIKV